MTSTKQPLARLDSAKEFILASIAGSILSLIRLGTGFIRNKIIAVILGTSGVGLLAQGTQLSLLGISIGSLGMGPGIINILSKANAKNDRSEKQRILSTAFTLHAILIVFFLILSLGGLKATSELMFGTHKEWLKALFVILGIPFSVLASSYMEGILFGSNRYDLYIRASTVATVLGFVAFFPLLYFWGLNGAFLSLSVSGIILFFCFLTSTLTLVRFKELIRFGFESQEAKFLIKFGIVMLITGTLLYGSNLIVRREIILQFGANANGIIQVPLALTAYYTPFLTNPIWGRLHPFVGKHGNSPESHHQLGTILRINTFINMGLILALLCSRTFLIRIAYSKAFLEAAPLIPIECIGDIFFFITFSFSVYFLGASRLRIYLGGYVVHITLFLLSSFYLLPRCGSAGVLWGYVVASAIPAVLSILWFLFCKQGHEHRNNSAKTVFFLCICIAFTIVQSLILTSHPVIQWMSLAIYGLCGLAIWKVKSIRDHLLS